MSEINSEDIRRLADKHLYPYRVHNGQIIAEYCPFCHGGDNNDRNTFAVGLYNGAFNCMRGSCGKTGSFRELCDYFGERAPKTTQAARTYGGRKCYKRPNPLAFYPPTPEIYEYFEKYRGISRETVDAFRIKSDDKGQIAFPFYYNNKLIYIKLRSPKIPGSQTKENAENKKKEPKETQLENTEAILFNMDGVSFSKPLIITEGQIDAMSLYEAGITNVVSVPCGCNNMTWIDPCWDFLEKFQQIILFGDMDEPGLQMINTLMNRLGEDRCMVPPDYPINERNGKMCKDANEILLEYGKDMLVELIDQCEPAPINGVINLADVIMIDPSNIPRIKTGIEDLDKTIGGFSEGGLTVITGKTGEGKSTITGTFLLNAINQDYNVCAYSGELPKTRFLEWIMLQATDSRLVGVSEDLRMGKRYSKISDDIQTRIKNWINHKFYLFDNDYYNDKITQQQAILDVFKICARRYGCKLFLVDNLMVALETNSKEENRAQADFAAALKKFAEKNCAHVILVAHPRKTKQGEELRGDDVAGSSAIVNLADNLITIEKPYICVKKNRDFGLKKTIEFEYNPANRRIYQKNIGDKMEFSWDHSGVKEPEERADSFTEFLPADKADRALMFDDLYGQVGRDKLV